MLHDGLVEGLHSVLGDALLDRALDEGRLLRIQEVLADRGRDRHDFRRRDSSPLVGTRHEPQRDDRLQRRGEHVAGLLVLVRREEGEDAVDRLRRVGRVEGREHEMPGVGRHERRLHRLRVTDLPDQNHVGILPQDMLQTLGEGGGIQPYLALGDRALLVAVQELDGVFDGDHVPRHASIHGVDHRRQRGGFAAPDRAAHQHESARTSRDLLNHRRKIQLLKGWNRGRHLPKHHRDGSTLLVEVAAETRKAGDPEGEVHLLGVLEYLFLLRCQDLIDDRLEIRLGWWRLVERGQAAVHARGGLRADFDVKIGRFEFHHLLQHSLDVHPHSPPGQATPRCRTPPGTASARTPRAARFRRESGRCGPPLRIRSHS